jgi:DNA invertase Pin-like site-specific DNA recombinase
MPTAYSYIRFSSIKQKDGDSKDRQQELINSWKKDNASFHFSTKSFKDLGVSGYSGKHLKTEEGMGAILKAITEKKIVKGDVILVEAVNRIGRLPTSKMNTLISSILDAGISIITLEDNIVYSEDTIDNDPSRIYILIGKIQQAHAYSKNLSRLLISSRKSTRNKVIAGEKQKITKLCPWWLEYNDNNQQWVELPEQVKVVNIIFDKYISGSGIQRITKELNTSHKQGIRNSNKGWHGSAISRCLFDRRVLGELIVNQRSDTPQTIENYFPEVINRDIYLKVLGLKKARLKERDFFKRKEKHIKKKPFDIFSGLVFCKCGAEAQLLNKGKNSWLYQCKKSIRSTCNESRSMNKDILHLHLRLYLYQIFQYSYEQNLVDILDEHENDREDYQARIDKLQVKSNRIQKLYAEGVAGDEIIEELHLIRQEISDLTKLKEGQDNYDPLKESFDIKDLLEMDIEGFSINTLLKNLKVQVHLFGNFQALLMLNGVKALVVGKITKTGKGSVSMVPEGKMFYTLTNEGIEIKGNTFRENNINEVKLLIDENVGE